MLEPERLLCPCTAACLGAVFAAECDLEVLFADRCVTELLCVSVCSVPGAPPSQVEVQPLNSTSIRVSWRSVKPDQRNGQIRGYQVHYALLENGESRGLPRIRDIMLDDSQVRSSGHPHHDVSAKTG